MLAVDLEIVGLSEEVDRIEGVKAEVVDRIEGLWVGSGFRWAAFEGGGGA